MFVFIDKAKNLTERQEWKREHFGLVGLSLSSLCQYRTALTKLSAEADDLAYMYSKWITCTCIIFCGHDLCYKHIFDSPFEGSYGVWRKNVFTISDRLMDA